MLTFLLSAGPASLANSASEDHMTGLRLAALLRAARSIISNHQDLINDPSPGNKHLTGERVVEEAAALFQEREGQLPLSEALNDRDRKLIDAEVTSIREIIDENQSLINAEGIAFKGFIPAVFARLVNERFAEKVGAEALLKVTAPIDLVRNRKAHPDDWEQSVFADQLQREDWLHGEAFMEEAEHSGRTAFRMLIPEYYSVSCLTCHGGPKGELDVTGYPKEGGGEGDLAGAISITLFR
jgi:hypothetical protein